MTLFPSFFVNKTGGYEIEQSLRFDGSEFLSWTPSSSGNFQTWTVSTWIKNCTTSDSSTRGIFGVYTHSFLQLYFSTQAIQVWDGTVSRGTTSAYFRDPSAWYHVLYKCDSNSLRLYINNQLVFGPTATSNSGFNRNLQHVIGRGNNTTGFKGYIAEHHQIDGTALDPTDFGEYDDNGVWRPIAYTGSHGTNGFYLTFDPSATNGIGHDHSGNGNNFTPTGFTTSGTGTDVVSDTPTTNWCTLNPLDAGTTGLLSDGNLIFNLGSGTDYTVRATQGMSSGKWYAEWTYNSGVNSYVGIASYAASLNAHYLGQDQYGYAYDHAGDKYNNNSGTSYGSAYTHGDVIGIAFDADAGNLTFYKNGTSQGTAFTGLSDFPYFFAHGANNCNGTFNFGQRDFEYTPPTGFKALNTANLPAPDIADGSANFNTVLYTGNGSTQSITGVGFQPDLVWIKSRSAANWHGWYDAVRGASTKLSSNYNGAEFTVSGVSSFNTDGFSLGSDGGENQSGATFAAWNWLAANGTSSNTDGSITSTVSANPSAGFSIVTYSGNATNNTVGHGLGVAPSMIICKKRNVEAGDWGVYHAGIGATKYLILNTTAGQGTASTVWQDTPPTATTFAVGTSSLVNQTSRDFVAYCFAEVEGYSKFGSYTGNGSTDGPFIYTGHRSRWLMIKAVSGITGNWVIFDTERDTDNPAITQLWSNLSSSESALSGQPVDILSNGFKIRTNDSAMNYNTSSTYLFVSFAEHPFGGSGVSPATAR
jgi:hypothetical protein